MGWVRFAAQRVCRDRCAAAKCAGREALRWRGKWNARGGMFALALVLASVAGEPAARRAPRQADPVTLRFAADQGITAPAAGDAEVGAARALALAAAGEPSVEAVRQAVETRCALELERFGSFGRRARLAAWLPRLTAEFEHAERWTRVVGLTGSAEADYLRLSPGNQMGLRAVWDLDRLVFSRDELAAAETAARLARLRDEEVERATRLYFHRLRLKVDLALAPPAEARGRAGAELELAQATAELDALTGGLYTRGSSPGQRGGP